MPVKILPQKQFLVQTQKNVILFLIDRYDSFIDLQDKLHQNLARKRTLVSSLIWFIDTEVFFKLISFFFLFDGPKIKIYYRLRLVPTIWTQSKDLSGIWLYLHQRSSSSLSTRSRSSRPLNSWNFIRYNILDQFYYSWKLKSGSGKD